MRNATMLAAGVLLWVLLILSACVEIPVPSPSAGDSPGAHDSAALLVRGLPRLDASLG